MTRTERAGGFRIPFLDDAVVIPLRGKPGGFAVIDADAYDAVKWWTWWNIRGYARAFYWIDNRQYGQQMHRVILSAEDGQVVDHKNHDRTDNRRTNIRLCTVQQNNLNNSRRPGKKLGMRGIYKHGRKYRAYIGAGGAFVLESFDDIESALAWRRKKEAELHGEFAYSASVGGVQ